MHDGLFNVRLFKASTWTLLFFLLPTVAFGHLYSPWLGEERFGPDSATSKTHGQPGWPSGMLPIPQHATRVYSFWVNGNEGFYFNGQFKDVSKLIQLYSKVALRDHVVTVKPGSPEVTSFHKTKLAYNVSFNYLNGIALWHSRSTAKAPSTFEATLTVHVDEEMQKKLKDFKWPENLIVKNEVKGLEIKSPRKAPKRSFWHAKVNFEDGKPASDLEHGMSTTVTLWQKGQPASYDLGKVSVKGEFSSAFSEEEIAAMKSDEMWLTMTVGNYLTKAEAKHDRLPLDSLHRDKSKLKPVKIGKPGFYHGRILFEDGSPPILKPEPWRGARIQISFPYAGMVRPDKQGFFKVTFTSEQIKAMQARKAGKNIYVPRYDRKNSSTALHNFPVDLLSKDKSKAGVVRIPKPRGR